MARRQEGGSEPSTANLRSGFTAQVVGFSTMSVDTASRQPSPPRKRKKRLEKSGNMKVLSPDEPVFFTILLVIRNLGKIKDSAT